MKIKSVIDTKIRVLRGGGGEREGGQALKIYSFRPLPLMRACGWMIFHLTVQL